MSHGDKQLPVVIVLLLLLDEKWTKALELIHREAQIDSMLHRKKYHRAASCTCPTAYKKLSFSPQSLSQTFAQLTLFALTLPASCILSFVSDEFQQCGQAAVQARCHLFLHM